ncbi:hypothetical protein AGMMS49992_33610 [Clostridia bacterium]|nr:hypothetical protein AGMMS49992_33610 [Clostridia bacterium]
MKLYFSETDYRLNERKTIGAEYLGIVHDSTGERLIALFDKACEAHTDALDALYQVLCPESLPKPVTFAQLIVDHITRIGCKTAADFSRRTLLDRSFFGQFLRLEDVDRTPNTIWSIIAGFKLNINDALEMLVAADITLRPDKYEEDRIYHFMLRKLEGRPIAEWNAFLIKRGLPGLGSKSRMKTSTR